MIIDNLNKRPIATVPNDTTDPPRFGQPVETTKDVFKIELEKFFDRAQISASRLEEIPTIRKFDISFKESESSLETATKIIQKFPDIAENLPLIAILGSTGRNMPMGIGGQFVHAVVQPSFVTSSINQPYVLADAQTLKFRTITPQKETRITTILFRTSRFVDITQATAQEVVNEINFQALFSKASINSSNGITISYGGPADNQSTGDIIMGDGTGDTGTAAAALGFVDGQQALFTSTTPFNRYMQATSLNIAIEIVTENYNARTELNDLVWSFFTFFMDERDYTFLGRSTFDTSIPNETYQVIIKPDPSMAGEQEVPRPGDEVDKLYVNRISIPVTAFQYIDRAVLLAGTTTPLYLDADSVQLDETLPQKN